MCPFDDYLAHQSEHPGESHRHGSNHRARNHITSSRTNEGRSDHASRSRHDAGRPVDYGSSYISSRRTADRAVPDHSTGNQDHSHMDRRSRSRAPTRASTVYPDDSISNVDRRSYHQRDIETRGYSRAPSDGHRQPTMEGYLPTPSHSFMYSSLSSREKSSSTRRYSAMDLGPMYGYASLSRSQRTHETPSNVSSSTVTHPSAYDTSGMTHTWHPPRRYQATEASHRSRRSAAPSVESRTSYGQSFFGTHCSVSSCGTPLPPCSVHGYPPPPLTSATWQTGRQLSLPSTL
jgi:hypothetical protein